MPGLLSGLLNKGGASSSQGYNPLQTVVPVRASPDQPDKDDSARIAWVMREYRRQTDSLLVADRQIEYNIRMLCGQQWNFWDWKAGQYMDVSSWFTEEEQRWRQLPVLNDELRWFVNTHARLTENPPTLTWLPGPDKADADLASILDALVKMDWRRTSMPTLHPEIMMWLLVAGRGHCVTRIDPSKGDWRPWVGKARLPMMDAGGNPMLESDGSTPIMTDQEVPFVPIGPDYKPRAFLSHEGKMVPTGKPHMERTGGLAVDVYSPLQVRGEWGPQLWHQKRWHSVTRFLTPEQVFANWGVEVEPDVNAEGASNVAILERVLFGAGFYGSSRGVTGGAGFAGNDVKGPLCTIIERWEAPLGYDQRLVGTWAEPLMETPENPGGRHTILSPKTVIVDGPREVRWPHVSPVRCFDYIRLAGRPRGMTTLESLHSPSRFQNKMTQIVQDAAILNGTPQRVVFAGKGIQADQIDNAPNRVYESTGEPSDGSPIVFLTPPPMNGDVFKVLSLSSGNLERLGGLRGTQGGPPTDDPSGELVKELRFNADRDLGDCARRSAEEYARLAEDWRAAYPLLYTMQQVLAITGTETAASTIVVFPQLFEEGTVAVTADAESMLPEGRGERQARAYRLYKDGVFGNPMDPAEASKARMTFLDMSRFPNYDRMARPGGVDRITAEKENANFLMGAQGAPVLQWYDNVVHMDVHEEFMKSADFLKQTKEVQNVFAFHRILHLQAIAELAGQLNTVHGGAQNGGVPGGTAGPGGTGPASGPADSLPAAGGPASVPKSQGGALARGPLGASNPSPQDHR